MMERPLKQYVVDAFTDRVFSGNPAAVCIMDQWPEDEKMRCIAGENNLSETAFAVREQEKGTYRLRWFTPGGEIDLCGHATLASAYVIMNFYEPDRTEVIFSTLSGDLSVVRKGDLYEMDFPAYELTPAPLAKAIAEAIGAEPKEVYMGRDLLCVFDDEAVVRNMRPDQERVKELPGLLLQVTAPGKDSDCVSRTFAPKMGISEDPVCGSGHCHIVPYWASRFGKQDLVAYQASPRGGRLYCSISGNRVKLAGKAALYSVGEIYAGV